jgi:hypothetical protein
MIHPSEGELFRKILGPAWISLHPDIQRRFEKNPLPGRPLYYTGTLTQLNCSGFGRLLGWMTLPFLKGALLPFRDRDFPVDIQVYSQSGCPFIFKQRIYRLNRRKAIQFTSYMAESERGEVLEYVGMGLGMKLVLDVRDGNLHFTSDGYFWQIGPWRIPLPGLLTPGKTYLCHRNESREHFSIRIEILHPWFGTSFTQAGVFRERPDDGRPCAGTGVPVEEVQ